MTIFLYIVAYIVIPFIIFSINDFFYGYFGENYGAPIYDEGNMPEVVMHMLWPLVVFMLIVIWIISFLIYVYNDVFKVKFCFKDMNKFRKMGSKKHALKNDLDYQAEKYLTGKKK